jgi:hypothetical protein
LICPRPSLTRPACFDRRIVRFDMRRTVSFDHLFGDLLKLQERRSGAASREPASMSIRYPTPWMMIPVPSQRSQALSLPVTLSTSLPVPAHSGQRSSAVPGVPGSGSSSGVCGLSGFDFMVGLLPRCWL